MQVGKVYPQQVFVDHHKELFLIKLILFQLIYIHLLNTWFEASRISLHAEIHILLCLGLVPEGDTLAMGFHTIYEVLTDKAGRYKVVYLQVRDQMPFITLGINQLEDVGITD